MDVTEMFADFDFNEPADTTVTEINGIRIPEDYLAFMKKHNGGEGSVGENGYMQLVKLEELESFNEDYEIPKWFPDKFIFGTDLGGILFGYDSVKKTYCAIDSCSISEKDVFYAGKSFDEFILAVGE